MLVTSASVISLYLLPPLRLVVILSLWQTRIHRRIRSARGRWGARENFSRSGKSSAVRTLNTVLNTVDEIERVSRATAEEPRTEPRLRTRGPCTIGFFSPKLTFTNVVRTTIFSGSVASRVGKRNIAAGRGEASILHRRSTDDGHIIESESKNSDKSGGEASAGH